MNSQTEPKRATKDEKVHTHFSLQKILTYQAKNIIPKQKESSDDGMSMLQ